MAVGIIVVTIDVLIVCGVIRVVVSWQRSASEGTSSVIAHSSLFNVLSVCCCCCCCLPVHIS